MVSPTFLDVIRFCDGLIWTFEKMFLIVIVLLGGRHWLQSAHTYAS